jgi:hypothetical protein
MLEQTAQRIDSTRRLLKLIVAYWYSRGADSFTLRESFQGSKTNQSRGRAKFRSRLPTRKELSVGGKGNH